MRTVLFAGAAALTLTALPAALGAQSDPSAHDAHAAAAAAYTMTPEQRAMFDAWPSDRQMYYNSLDAAHQAWFWSLTPRQMEGYWVLTADQRERVFAMTPAARANAWASIEAQLAAGANDSATSAARTGGPVPRGADVVNAQVRPAPSTTTVIADADPATPDTVVTSNPGNLAPPPAQAMNKTYPVCTRTLQDSCQNPGEGGAPGKSRALGYWPGEPASERRERGG